MSCYYDKRSPLYPRVVNISSKFHRRQAGKSCKLSHRVSGQQFWPSLKQLAPLRRGYYYIGRKVDI